MIDIELVRRIAVGPAAHASILGDAIATSRSFLLQAANEIADGRAAKAELAALKRRLAA